MRAFTALTAPAVAIDRPNIDTDLLVPKQFLTRIDRTGYGQFLLHDLRFLEDGSPNPGFILNRPEAAGAAILLAGPNFGIGSSREHAVWALDGFGFRVVIAPSFGDIFYNNALGDGLLLIVLGEPELRPLMAKVLARQGAEVTVDLRELKIAGPEGLEIPFQMEAERRERHLGGLDAIGLTLQREAAIEAYERTHGKPWQACGPQTGGGAQSRS
jgi:3-isopropylmalate/(R)-2-methylmalate dehydratase small subunit